MRLPILSTRRALAVAAIGSASLAAGCEFIAPWEVSEDIDFGSAELRQFETCDELSTYLRGEVDQRNGSSAGEGETGFWYEPFTRGAGGEVAVSGTNNQEAGVDEADIVQADAQGLFVLRDGEVVATDLSSTLDPDPDVLSTIPVDGRPIEMLLSEDRLVVVASRTPGDILMQFGASALPTDSQHLLTASVWDVSDRRSPQLRREVVLDGELLATRLVGERLYLVSRAGTTTPEDMDDVMRMPGIQPWMPDVYSTSWSDGMPSRPQIGHSRCDAAYVAREVAGTSSIAIASFPLLDDAASVDTATVFGDATLAYASPVSIVIANQAAVGVDGLEYTELHRFDLTADGAEYDASGRVLGRLLNSFGLSEHDGFVRAVTWEQQSMTTLVLAMEVDELGREPAPVEGSGAGPSMNLVDRELEVVSRMDLAPGEELFGVRFRGDLAYVVTFRQQDPLWVVDLADPRHPAVRGELFVPGYSTYLHSVGGGRLLGVGLDARVGGSLKLSLFDVSEADAPQVMQEIVAQGATSAALDEHRAFRWIADHDLVAVPVSGVGEGLMLVRVGENWLESVATLDHSGLRAGTTPAIHRSYRVGDFLYAISDAGITSIDLDSLETEGSLRLAP